MINEEYRAQLVSQCREWVDDVSLAVGLLTRVPMPHPVAATPDRMARAQRAFPLVGALIGLVVGLADRGLHRLESRLGPGHGKPIARSSAALSKSAA